MTARFRIPPDTPILECPSTTTSMRLPAPVNERLDQLRLQADRFGAATNRGELVAALVLASTDDPEALFELVVSYRRARAADAAVRGQVLGTLLEFRTHPRGPRPRERPDG